MDVTLNAFPPILTELGILRVTVSLDADVYSTVLLLAVLLVTLYTALLVSITAPFATSAGTSDGAGSAVGEGEADGVATGFGEGLGEAVAFGDGDGVTVGDGDTDGDADGVINGPGFGEGLDVGTGVDLSGTVGASVLKYVVTEETLAAIDLHSLPALLNQGKPFVAGWGADAGRILYGNGLCDKTDHEKRAVCVWLPAWRPDRDFPHLRSLRRGSVLCDHHR